MKLYYEREGIKLYHGDCAEAEFPCDLIVTDPPYGQNFVGRTDLWGAIQGDDDLAGTSERLRGAFKGLRRGRHVYIFGGDRFDYSTLPLCSVAELIWDKEIFGLGDLSLPWGLQHEKIFFAVYEISKKNREGGFGNLAARLRKGSILRSLRPHSGRVRHHPTEKPIDILRQLIESSSVMGETVYDPFVGSGSTLIAAALESRNAIGVEIEERYCETTAQRLEKEAPELFSLNAEK